MPGFASLLSLAPYHVLSYGTLLGSQVFQSFIGGVMAYRTLARPQFSALQQGIFPVYFTMQTALPVILALTYPGERDALGVGPSSVSGVLLDKHRVNTLLPLATILFTSLANLLIVGPATTKIMHQRKHQETREGKKSYDPPPHSKEMTRLNKSFARMHGISSLLNLAGLLGTVFYGVTLAERIR